jgi:hypothetical protein
MAIPDTTTRPIRSLRHWKQRFDRGAKFIWRRAITWKGKPVVPGAVIPKELADNPTKLKRFWESSTIELAQFEAPDVSTGRLPGKADTVVPKSAEDLLIKHANLWEVIGHPVKLRTKKEAVAIAEQLFAAMEIPEPEALEPKGLELLGESVVINNEIHDGRDILAFFMEEAECTVEQWNALDDETRNATISQGLQWMEDLGEDDELAEQLTAAPEDFG